MDRWHEIDALFDQALERAPNERAAFLEEAAAGDVELLAAVRALLASDAEAEAFIGESVTDFAAPLLPELQDRLIDGELERGARVGPYAVVHEVGRGGMGRVYLAERADGRFRRRVALKLIKRGMDTDEVLRRFQHEGEVLAGLEHDGIARLYSVGAADDGRPYLAMEFVDGAPIDRYCDERRLGVEERLRLFEGVAEAVQFAHRNLVVHRDLKPSNVLVTADGTVKLLDFGIAKLLADEPGPALTRTGVRVLTPEYAAPEQARGEPVTTATDVYSLGVLLYELLTGRRPFEGPPAAAAEPEQPSTVVTRPSERRHADGTTETVAPEAVSMARATTPERLQRRLRGDLDTILLKALRPEPERRYGSAQDFLDDVKRHLAGLPVTARPSTPGYRLRAFVRRHRTGVATVAGGALLLLGFAAFYVARITEERDRAAAERDKATATVAFLEALFEGADPDEALGDTLDVFDLLARGTQQLGALEAQPTVRASLQRTLGMLHLKLGDYDQAGPLLEEAVAERRRTADPADPTTIADLAASLESAGHLAAKQAAFDRADSLLAEAVALRQRAGDAAARAAALISHGDMLVEAGRFDRATARYEEALALLETEPGDTRRATVAAQHGLATIHMREARYAEAEALYRQVLDARRALYGDVHNEVAAALNDLGNLYSYMHTYDAADTLLSQALDVRRRLVGDTHPDVSLALHNLASVRYGQGAYAEAEALMRESLAIKERLLGREHRDIGLTLNNIGWTLLERGDLAGAEAHFREALGIMERVSGEVSADAGLVLGNVAWVLHQQGRPAEAEPFYRRALDVRRAVHGPDNMHVAWRQFALAEALRELERYEEAEALHRASLALRRALRAPDSFDVGRGLNGLGRTLIDRGRYTEAEALHREALPVFEALGDSLNLAITRSLLGACLSGQERYAEADPLLRQSHDYFHRDDPEGTLTQQALRRLIAHYEAWGKPEAAARFRRASAPADGAAARER